MKIIRKIVKFTYSILSDKQKINLGKLINLINIESSKNGKYFCSVCENSLKYFGMLNKSILEPLEKYEYIHNIFRGETINITNYCCPVCNASDRDRLYALYLKKYFEELNSNIIKFLDIAPSRSLAKVIRKYKNVEYITSDLMMVNVDYNLDIEDMYLFEDNSFDFLVCSHVLEHVNNDKNAVKEMHRILKVGGKGIIMAPIHLDLTENYENINIKTPEERWKHFAQDDHLRIYSKKGFLKLLESVNFKVEQLGINHFGKECFEKNGIIPRSVLYIVEKQ